MQKGESKMEKISTKEKILYAALDLFSKYGYEATSTEQIQMVMTIVLNTL